jgi:hypothetical protein
MYGLSVLSNGRALVDLFGAAIIIHTQDQSMVAGALGVRILKASVLLLSFAAVINSFATPSPFETKLARSMSSPNQNLNNSDRHPFCDLPGDPSMILTTNVDLGTEKLAIMKGEIEKSSCHEHMRVLRWPLKTVPLFLTSGANCNS